MNYRMERRLISRADYYGYLEAKRLCEKKRDAFNNTHFTYEDVMHFLFHDSEVTTCTLMKIK